jgi:hypothetical protein
MKSDIDELMMEDGLDALFVAGPLVHNPFMIYFTGIANVGHAYLLKPRGQPPVLFHGAMERDEAASTGLQTKNLNHYDLLKLLEEVDGDQVRLRSRLDRTSPPSVPWTRLFQRLSWLARLKTDQFSPVPGRPKMPTR